MATAVADGRITDRVYVHQLNLTSADLMKRQREKQMVEEEKRKVLQLKEIKLRQREEEKKRDMEMLLNYNPWGKPYGGAKGDDTKRKKYADEVAEEIPEDQGMVESLFRKFGRPGAGAPNRTDSGRIRTQITGDPAIRFQDTQHVNRSIENHLRYKNEDKENYRGNLDELVQKKLQLQEEEKEWEKKKMEEMKELYPFGRENNNGGSYLSHADTMFMATRPRRMQYAKEDYDPWGKGFGNPARDHRGNVQRYKFARAADEGIPEPDPSESNRVPLNLGKVRGGNGAPHITDSGQPRTKLQHTLRNIKSMGPHIKDPSEIYHPWGKPGAGAPFVRQNGRPFEEKMGWSLTGHPKKRSKDAKREYMNALQKEMEERKQRNQEERHHVQEAGQELASIIRQSKGGRPLKDPVTGELLPNPRKLTDVTQQRLDIRRAQSQETLAYHSELAEQAAQREEMRQKQKQLERAQSEKHLTTWDTFWGRPGHGAPINPENHKKENLNYLLTSPDTGGQPYVKHYVTEVVPSKHKNRYDYSTENVPVVKREYQFRTPFPAAEA